MVLGLPVTSFLLLVLIAILSGAAGAVCALLIYHKIQKKRSRKQSAACENTRAGWARMTRDEQMYNGR